MMKLKILLIIFISYTLFSCKNFTENKFSIFKEGNDVKLKAGILERNIQVSENAAYTTSVLVDGENVIQGRTGEFSAIISKALPNEEPKGIGFSSAAGVEQKESVKNQTDALNVNKKDFQPKQGVKWENPVNIIGAEPCSVFDSISFLIDSQEADKSKLIIVYYSNNPEWEGIKAEIIYEIYMDFPAIRKWIKFSNKGSQWIKIDNLVIDDIKVAKPFATHTILTPHMRGIDPSIVAFHDPLSSRGIIISSEVPSKLRKISDEGATGYNPDYFEWVVGPDETFKSVPVFMYAFSEESYPTVSSISTAVDRCVETDFKTFLEKHILPRTSIKKEIAPVFCTWTNYSSNINESNMREAAKIASYIGFKYFQLDAGWSDTQGGSWAISTINPNHNKFPDLVGLSNYIRSKGMKTGLWYSVFTSEKIGINTKIGPILASLPIIRRDNGVGLSMCYSKSRKKYINDLLYLHLNYNADYFKQDLSNICYGDIAQGHESRTLKESYLRGLRGLLAIQDEIHKQAPEIWLQLSHEIYWETPGPEADVAVLKHVDSYHAAPNEYWGAGKRSKRVSPDWGLNPDSLKQKLINGAFRARLLFYAHRGLPVDRIKIFGAVTTNYKGSLTPEVQDRQICSWLMGAPLSYSGDLSSLTKENIEHYRDRFAMLGRLQNEYGIYSYFQFSGVPAPTDEDWHWWGKLNPEACGVVIVIRGSSGEESRIINIPWVLPDKKYRVKGLFSRTEFGVLKGEQLKNGSLTISLKPYC